jgi:DNA topoisomerase IB
MVASAPARRSCPRLRRSDCSLPGLHRTRRGHGFSYYDVDGQKTSDPEVLERVRGLAIPPAWKDVWICDDPWGHLQATGIDAAGRKQYLYHAHWRERKDREKFDRMVRFAQRLPRLRRRIAGEIEGTEEPTRERILAGAADGAEATLKTARKRVVDHAVRGVAELLGNTPAVARRAYIDPRVFDRYAAGATVARALPAFDDLDAIDDRKRARLEQAVLALLSD